jgi:ABC-type multidrug transport system ATPase subunit
MAAKISYIPEQPIYYEELTVEENLKLYAMLSGTPRREFAEKNKSSLTALIWQNT